MVVATLEKPKAAAVTPSIPNKLWSQPIEVLGLTGDFASGKTLFSLSISPGAGTLHYDTEKSASVYEGSLGFHRVDLVDEMLRKFPKGHKPIDLFVAWHEHVRSIKPGQYKVIALDCVSEIEEGLVEWVRRNPQEFGYTANQFAKAEALMWGCVKSHWKRILSDIAARCETFAFCSHLKAKFVNNAPTREKVAKGKETLMELATLYLRLERVADKKGNIPSIPAAIVLKSRLASAVTGEDGSIEFIPTLPPRIPLATPKAIRQYMASPPDYSKLKAGERAEEKEMTEEEKLSLQLAVAEAQGTAESLKLTRIQQAAEAAKRFQSSANGANGTNGVHHAPAVVEECPVIVEEPQAEAQPDEVTVVQEVAEAQPVDDQPPAAMDTTPGMITPDQIDQIIAIRNELSRFGYTLDDYRNTLAKRGVGTARDLTSDQAAALIEGMNRALRTKMEISKYEPVEAKN